jgi:DHA2 family multidrug resistance protein
VQQQARLLAYMDQYRMLTYILICMLPMVFFLKKPPRQTGKIELDVH